MRLKELPLGKAVAREEWGRNSMALLKAVATLAPAVVLAKVFTAGGQLAAGRLLGPAEFGTANVALAVSAFLAIPLQGFFAGMVKLTAMEESFEAQARIVSTALWLHLGLSAVCALAFLALRGPLARLFHVDGGVYSWSVVYTLALCAYTIISALPQAVLRFRERGLLEVLYGGGSLALFLIFFYVLSIHSYLSFLNGLCTSLLLASAVCLVRMRRWLRFVVDARIGRSLLAYFAPMFINSCSSAAAQAVVPLMLAAYLSTTAVGFFGIYSLGSIGIAGGLVQIISLALAPMASSPSRQKGAWRKFFLLVVPLALVAVLVFACAQFAALKLAGRSYPIRWDWIALFAATAAMFIVATVAQLLLTFRDVSGAWLVTGGSALNSLTLVLAALWAVPRYGFLGSIAALLASYVVAFVWYSAWGLLKQSAAS